MPGRGCPGRVHEIAIFTRLTIPAQPLHAVAQPHAGLDRQFRTILTPISENHQIFSNNYSRTRCLDLQYDSPIANDEQYWFTSEPHRTALRASHSNFLLFNLYFFELEKIRVW